jgi:hypothetical protein
MSITPVAQRFRPCRCDSGSYNKAITTKMAPLPDDCVALVMANPTKWRHEKPSSVTHGRRILDRQRIGIQRLHLCR